MRRLLRAYMPIIDALKSYWWRHKIQFLTLFFGLALATTLWTAVQIINAHARASYAASEQNVKNLEKASFRRLDGDRFDERAFADFRRAGIDVTPILKVRAGPASAPLDIIGIDPLSAKGFIGAASPQVSGGGQLDFFQLPGVLLVAPSREADLRDYLTSLALPRAAIPAIEPRENLQTDLVIGDIGVVQTLIGAQGQISELLLLSEPHPGAAQPVEDWRSILVRVNAPVQLDIAELTDSFHLNLTAFGLLCFLVGLFIVYSAVGLAFEDRIPTIRTLRICGIALADLAKLLCLEILIISFLAGLTGIFLGYIVALFLLPDVALSLRGLYGADLVGEVTLEPSWIISGLSISVLGGFASSAGALMKLFRMPLLSRHGTGNWRRHIVLNMRIRVGASLGCVLIAAACYHYASGIIAAFTVMACILLCGAFFLPVFLGALTRLAIRSSRSPMALWFWSDAERQLPQLSIALSALLLALAANIGVGTMVDGFRKTFLLFLDERLAAELYIDAGTTETAAEISNWLRDYPGVRALLPNWTAQSSHNGKPVIVTSFADHSTFRDTWSLLAEAEGAWDSVMNGQSLFINEQLARRAKITVGDMLGLDTPFGPRMFRVSAIYADYGNSSGAVRMAGETLLSHWPSARRSQLGVRFEGQIETLKQRLQERFSLGDNQVIDQQALKAFSINIFEKTFAVSAALNSLTLGVAGFALFTSLLTLTRSRLAAVAPVWAIGFSRRTLSRLEFIKVTLLALFTAIAAIPLGIAVAWCLVAVVNVEAFGWRLPLYIFPTKWLSLTGIGVISASLAALYPVIKLARISPAQLAKVFANER